MERYYKHQGPTISRFVSRCVGFRYEGLRGHGAGIVVDSQFRSTSKSPCPAEPGSVTEAPEWPWSLYSESAFPRIMELLALV